MSKPDMGSIFHIKNQRNILVIGNYYLNYQNYQNLILLTSSDTKRTLKHLFLLTNSTQRELVSICTQIYATAINFPCIITLPGPLGSCKVPTKMFAHSVQPFLRLLDINLQTNRQTSKVQIFSTGLFIWWIFYMVHFQWNGGHFTDFPRKLDNLCRRHLCRGHLCSGQQFSSSPYYSI